MVTRTTTIQEITQQAYVFGIFDILFNEKNMPRDEIFNLLEEWADEFIEEENKHYMESDWFYYDEIDIFLQNKKAQL
jgi:hypothetical protein